MKNPWETIELTDYENHMKLDSVMQLQALNKMMKEQFYQYTVKSIMILGVAGGNGLEHINPQIFDKAIGIDINPNYLIECTKRYPQLKEVLDLLCVDLTKDITILPYADLVIADLLIEYIGYSCFQKTIQQIKPQYVSCIIQINTDKGFVSDSPYRQAFEHLEGVHHQMGEQKLIKEMVNINYSLVFKILNEMPNGKKLLRLDFKRK